MFKEKLQIPKLNQYKIKYWKFVTAFLTIIIIVIGGFIIWNNYFSPEAKYQREMQKNYKQYLEWQKNYENAMKNDTYDVKNKPR